MIRGALDRLRKPRIPREAITPSLAEALASFTSDASGGSVATIRPDRARALLQKQSDLQTTRGYGVVLLVMAAALIGLFLLAGESPLLLLVPGTVAAAIGALTVRIRAQRPDGPSPTIAFLKAALADLELGPVQRIYAEALVAVHGGDVRDPGGDALTLLRRLAEEEDRWLRLFRTVALPQADEVAAEAQKLQTLAEHTVDPSAREALAHSLTLVQNRAATAERASEMRARLEAHRHLLEQSARSIAQGVMGWSELSTETEELRENLATLGRESQVLEAAVQEMRAL